MFKNNTSNYKSLTLDIVSLRSNKNFLLSIDTSKYGISPGLGSRTPFEHL